MTNYRRPHKRPHKFVVGDIAILASGSPQLRVEEIVGKDDNGIIVRCSWATSEGRKSDNFYAGILRLV